MSRSTASHQGTTHGGGGRGPGGGRAQKTSNRFMQGRAARPPLVGGAPTRGRSDVAFLKTFGSRPERMP